MVYSVSVTQKEQASEFTADLLVAPRSQEDLEPMATVLVSEHDPRGAKAVAIATNASQWLKCRSRDGRKAYGVPSSKDSNRYYLVTRSSCDCYDARSHECKHQLAVQLHCALVAEQLDKTAAKYDDVFKRFDYDEDRAMARILGRSLPKTERED